MLATDGIWQGKCINQVVWMRGLLFAELLAERVAQLVEECDWKGNRIMIR